MSPNKISHTFEKSGSSKKKKKGRSSNDSKLLLQENTQKVRKPSLTKNKNQRIKTDKSQKRLWRNQKNTKKRMVKSRKNNLSEAQKSE